MKPQMPPKHYADDTTTFGFAATTNLPYERNLDERDGDPESMTCYDFVSTNTSVGYSGELLATRSDAFGMKLFHQNRGNGSASQTAVGGDECCFLDTASTLAEIGAGFYLRGWVLGTGGNFSSVLSSDPLRLAITPTGSHKGELNPTDILEIDEAGEVLRGSSRPSFEYMLHLAIIRARGAGAVLHTHSIWATILSGRGAPQRGLTIEGYEMLKGLEGVSDHRHREWIPILPNSQDMVRLGATVETMLDENPDVHGFLLERHGLYTWGPTLSIARRHVEIIEFLLEVVGHTAG